MRVTTIIKDYITSEIEKKYQEKLDSIPNEYQDRTDECIEELDALTEETNRKAHIICKKYDMDKEPNEDIFDYSSYYVDNEKLEKEHLQIVHELTKEKKDKINDIILGLELGKTNKKELTIKGGKPTPLGVRWIA